MALITSDVVLAPGSTQLRPDAAPLALGAAAAAEVVTVRPRQSELLPELEAFYAVRAPPQHRLSSNKMARVTSDCDVAQYDPERPGMALITSGCVPSRLLRPSRSPKSTGTTAGTTRWWSSTTSARTGGCSRGRQCYPADSRSPFRVACPTTSVAEGLSTPCPASRPARWRCRGAGAKARPMFGTVSCPR